jgi:hypothetical protein
MAPDAVRWGSGESVAEKEAGRDEMEQGRIDLENFDAYNQSQP